MSDNDLQSASRPNHSTSTALLRVRNDLLCILDECKAAVLVLLDLSAAFNTIDHTIMLTRLRDRFGITATCQFDSIRFDSIRFDSIRFDSIRFDSIRFDSIRFDSIRFDSIQFNSILLPIKQRIEYKLLLLTFRSLHGLAASYISDLLIRYEPTHALCFANAHLLEVPRCRLRTQGEKAFSSAAPRLWNNLPLAMTASVRSRSN